MQKKSIYSIAYFSIFNLHEYYDIHDVHQQRNMNDVKYDNIQAERKSDQKVEICKDHTQILHVGLSLVPTMITGPPTQDH